VGEVVAHGCVVALVHPRVCHDLLHRQPLLALDLEDFADEVAHLGGEVGGVVDLALEDALVHLLDGRAHEWQLARERGVQDHTQRPHVHGGPDVLYARDDLGGGVLGRAAKRLEEAGAVVQVAQAKVDDLGLLVVVQEYVFYKQQ